MIKNLVSATGYNVMALALAAGALCNQDVLLRPAAGGALITVSKRVVAISKVLKSKKINRVTAKLKNRSTAVLKK